MEMSLTKVKKHNVKLGHKKIVHRMRAKMVISRLFGWGDGEHKYRIHSPKKKKKSIKQTPIDEDNVISSAKKEYLIKQGLLNERLLRKVKKNKKGSEGNQRKSGFKKPKIIRKKIDFLKKNMTDLKTKNQMKNDITNDTIIEDDESEYVDLEIQCGNTIFVFKVSPENKRKLEENVQRMIFEETEHQEVESPNQQENEIKENMDLGDDFFD